MKKILLISDTHGYLDERLIEHAAAADEVWHAGDFGTADIYHHLEKLKPLKAVNGNIDGLGIRALCPEQLCFDCEGLKVLMIHIGGYPGKYAARIKDLLQQYTPGLFICGHSHILKVIYDKQHQLLHLNPGAAGREGFHQVRTALRFEVTHGEIKNLAVIELGKRMSLP